MTRRVVVRFRLFSLWTSLVCSFAQAQTAEPSEAVASDAQPSAARPEGEPPNAVEPSQVSDTQRLERLEATLKAQAARIDAQELHLKELAERAEAAERAALAAEETAAMTLATQAGEEALEEERLRLYGFADMAFTKLYIPDGTRFSGIVDRDSTFAMGNMNLYIDSSPSENIRFLGEIRFSLYPHGDYNDAFQREDTRTYDQTSATGRNRVTRSSTIIERAFIEWKNHDALRVRAGLFLTPYGIWNVDHGSPTLISSVLPTFWASEYFPTRQVGVQALGEVFRKEWEFGYRAYVSNGRMDQSQLEIDPFKLFGGRLYAKYVGDVDALIGVSGFWNQEATTEKSIKSFDPFLVEGKRTEQYEEWGIAADVSLDLGDLRTRTEFVLNQREYVDGLRARIPNAPVYRTDETRWNVYNTLAYRLPWAGLEPFTFLEYANRQTASDNSSWVFSGGLIEHIAEGTQLKFQGFFVHFPNDDVFADADKADFPGWDLRLVTVF